MRVLITGANGQLGNEMCRLGAVSPNEYLFTDVAELDITDKAAVAEFVKSNNVEIIVNCAAYTNVDKAEDDEATAELINATAVRNLAEAVKAVDGTLFHVSTDYLLGIETKESIDLSGLNDADIKIVKQLISYLKEKNSKK